MNPFLICSSVQYYTRFSPVEKSHLVEVMDKTYKMNTSSRMYFLCKAMFFLRSSKKRAHFLKTNFNWDEKIEMKHKVMSKNVGLSHNYPNLLLKAIFSEQKRREPTQFRLTRIFCKLFHRNNNPRTCSKFGNICATCDFYGKGYGKECPVMEMQYCPRFCV